MAPVLGAIADDFTGATDLANTWARQGLRVIQTVGVPADAALAEGAEAIVIALKSRTSPAREAVAESLSAYRWLKSVGVRQIALICPLLSGPKSGLDLATKEEWNGEEAQAGRDHRQAA